MIDRMRTDIRPRCDRHHWQMIKIPAMRAMYRCRESSCARHFGYPNGYFDLLEGGEVSNSVKFSRPSDGSAMYLAESNEQT
jgi:hypothetical protein